ncbi:MAG TPA: hypothetical protein VN678_07805 [Acidobacteriaceae bacterium]|nr:hypothetical protein [Acidobacteriaceae bacterium]
MLLMVAHTVREADSEEYPVEIIRIITARKATAREIWRYENENA